jgi:Flp pilus assembly pilin Flp
VQTRVTGVVGLLIVVLVAAGVIAGAWLVVWDALRNAWRTMGP